MVWVKHDQVDTTDDKLAMAMIHRKLNGGDVNERQSGRCRILRSTVINLACFVKAINRFHTFLRIKPSLLSVFVQG